MELYKSDRSPALAQRCGGRAQPAVRRTVRVQWCKRAQRGAPAPVSGLRYAQARRLSARESLACRMSCRIIPAMIPHCTQSVCVANSESCRVARVETRGCRKSRVQPAVWGNGTRVLLYRVQHRTMVLNFYCSRVLEYHAKFAPRRRRASWP